MIGAYLIINILERMNYDKLSGVDYEESNVDRMMMASKTNTMTVTYTIRNN